MVKKINKKIAVIGAGIAAVPILKKAKELKVTTYCFATVEGSVAVKYCDYFIPISIFDIEKLYEKIKGLDVDGIIATSEITTETVAILADKLKLPGNDIKNGFCARNKYIMRNRIQNIKDVYQPNYALATDKAKFEYPVVVKSPDSFGKKGISIANNDEEYFDAVKYARKYSGNGEVLIEEYIKGGREFSVECVSDSKNTYIVQITEKVSSGPPHFVELEHHQPACINNEEKKKIIEASKKIIKRLGIYSSLAHLELKLVKEKIYFIEVGARAGGDHIGDILVGLSTEFDLYKAAIEVSMGTYLHTSAKNVGYSGIYFFSKLNEEKLPLLTNAYKNKWCYHAEIYDKQLKDVKGNGDESLSGYFIYKSDHKINIKDLDGEAVLINDYLDAKNMLIEFYKKAKVYKAEKKIIDTVSKFLKLGNIYGIVNDGKVSCMLNLYCNNLDTREAYICDVFVLKEYRGNGLSKLILKEAIDKCIENKFQLIRLHVAKNNNIAINLYKQYGFVESGYEENDVIEMTKLISVKENQ